MVNLDPDVLQHMLSFVRSYPQCVLLAMTSKLHPLLIAKPLSRPRAGIAGHFVGPGRTALEEPRRPSSAAIKQLALVAEKFPLDQRHWQPLPGGDFLSRHLPPGRRDIVGYSPPVMVMTQTWP